MSRKNEKRDKRSFCNGLLCKRFQRKKCNKCTIYVCKTCSITIFKKIYCVDCGVDLYAEKQFKEWKEAFKELGFN